MYFPHAFWDMSPTYRALIPVMTSANTPSGEASASTEFSAAWAAWKAVNDITIADSHWFGTASTGWWKYNFVSPKRMVRAYSFFIAPEAGWPCQWTFEASDDGSSWTILDTVTFCGQSDSPNEDIYLFRILNNTYYSQYRFNVTQTLGPGTIAMDKIQMYGF